MKIGIGEPNPLTDLHVIGVVRRIEEDLYDYGDVVVGEHCHTSISLVSCLLKFEGKRVEVLVNILEESE